MTTTPAAAPARHPSPPAVSDPAPRSIRAAAAATMLRHARAGRIALRGPRTGRVYVFSDREPTAVLADDVDALLRSGVLTR